MRRMTIIALTLLLIAGACGDDDAVTGAPAITAAPATTPSTSTSTTTITTTTPPPIPETPLDPVALPMPVLTDEFGGGVVETWCEIEYSEMADGTLILDPVQTAIFRFLGIEHDRDDCDLALDDLIEAERYSATYSGVGTCFTGYTIEGAIVVRTHAGEFRWPVDVDHEPPTTISGCRGDEEPPGGPVPFGPRVRPLHQPLVEALGSLGSVAWAYGGLLYLPLDDAPPDPEVYDILAAGLQHESPSFRCDTAWIVMDLTYRLPDLPVPPGERFDAGLQTLVPYLIDTLVDLSESDESEDRCDEPLNSALAFLTGQDLWGPRAWAEWWVADGGD